MKRKILILLFISAIIGGCSTQMNVVQLRNNLDQNKQHGIVYFLPRTIVEVDIEVTTEKFIPGPYNRYADKFLSISSAPSQGFRKSEISDIRINQHFTPDPNSSFLITGNQNNTFYFNKEMILLSMNKNPYTETPDYSFVFTKNIPEYFPTEVYFTDLTSEENFTSILDTTYRVIEIDSVFQKIPVYNSVMTSKTIEQKAEEAAEFIIELRKNRFILASGDMDILPESGAIKTMLAHIDRMESKYLELFVGKTVQVTNTYSFTYTPDENQQNEDVIIFYLCDEHGITQSESPEKYPVVFKFENHNTLFEVNRFFTIQNEVKENKNGLFYRIPGYATVYIAIDDEIYASKKMIVPQCGLTTRIPDNLMESKDLKLQLHPQTGGLIMIKP